MHEDMHYPLCGGNKELKYQCPSMVPDAGGFHSIQISFKKSLAYLFWPKHSRTQYTSSSNHPNNRDNIPKDDLNTTFKIVGENLLMLG